MIHRRRRPGYLLLEDGALFAGDQFLGSVYSPLWTDTEIRPPKTAGAESCPTGEAVFNTSHSGYQEIITDPSYLKQIIVFTAAHIGNVGVNREDMESQHIRCAGIVVRNLTGEFSNWRGERSLEDFARSGDSEVCVPILSGVDTRAVTLHLRSRGAQRAGLFPVDVPVEDALVAVRASPSMSGADLASEASCREAFKFELGGKDYRLQAALSIGRSGRPAPLKALPMQVAVLDYGVKYNILRELARRGCEVTVLPANTGAQGILNGGYDGVLLSNGPGDPAAVGYAVAAIRELLGKLPLFGICLGHQLVALATGMETFKLPFGHRGANHPVRRERDGRIEITSQNHGFAVRGDVIKPASGWEVTHINLNDGTVEGLAHREYPVFTIQYHPEASPGPHDGVDYFDAFVQMMTSGAGQQENGSPHQFKPKRSDAAR